MADPLKNNFNAILIERYGLEISHHYDGFQLEKFQSSVINEDWEARELKDRMRHLTKCIYEHLNLPYQKAISVIIKTAPKFGGFEAMTFPDIAEVYGLQDESVSLNALKELTKYSSSEFAIRPFIIQNQKSVMQTMLKWSKDSNEHVRRLSSEGCRPRLPWAMALPEFKKSPKSILPILENLIHDKSLYVRKSVANNLNDITKDNPTIALNFAKKWYGSSDHANWIIKHGLRTLLKKGDKTALDILGFNESPDLRLTNFSLSETVVKIGSFINFAFDISHLHKKAVFLKVGFVVSYVKKGGKVSDKIFHITEKSFEPNESYSFKKKLSFIDLSTRKHQPGTHKISITINGNVIGSTNLELID